MDNMTIELTDILKSLIEKAAKSLLSQQTVSITHEANWKRNGFPLPIKRMPVSEDGTITQSYRPLALLEYAHECLVEGNKIKAVAANTIESLAKTIYESWSGLDGYVPWEDGGNSLKQDEARDQARDSNKLESA